MFYKGGTRARVWVAAMAGLMASGYFFFAVAPSAFALSEKERNFLLMYFKEEELIVESPTRSPKPINQVAENITVITADDIERMNAHTLGEVLNTVTGVQVFTTGGPGSSAPIHIQGSEQRHVEVKVDGVSMALISGNVADTDSIPVQNIARIEIIKGPASSSWGSSLGGIVNVITKNPRAYTDISGTASLSYGEKGTGDYRAELSGEQGPFGYYLYAGRLETDGFRPNNDVADTHFYSKLVYRHAKRSSLTFTLGYNKGERGEGDASIPPLRILADNEFSTLFSTLTLQQRINDIADIQVSLRYSRLTHDKFTDFVAPFSLSQEESYRDEGFGGSAKLTWRPEGHVVVVGTDFDDRELRSNTISGGEQDLTKWAVYVNDTITWGALTVTPGLRYDHTSTNGDFTSPSLGLTYSLTKTALLRASVARGFSIPPLSDTFGTTNFFVPNPDLRVEKIWSYQAGGETALFNALWLKVSLFRHDIKDFITAERTGPIQNTKTNSERRRRQGVEIEIKTVPVYNTTLSAGMTFIDVEDPRTDKIVRNSPRYTYDFGLLYDDGKSFSALVKGHYIWWNAISESQGKYSSLIVDINLMKTLFKREDRSAEVFVTAHNIFDGAQYLVGFLKNPGRWIEGGVRYKF